MQLPLSFVERAEQLPLDLACASSASRDDVIEMPEIASAISLVDQWPSWPSYLAIMSGPSGCGKSHLADVWARSADAVRVTGKMLAGIDPIELSGRAALIENADVALANDRPTATQTGLFHLLNQLRATGGHVLITARTPPTGWPVTVADLASRFAGATHVRIEGPSDAFVEAVLWKLFADRQLTVGPASVARIAARIERSLSVASRAVERIDHIALAEGRRVDNAVVDRALAMI